MTPPLRARKTLRPGRHRGLPNIPRAGVICDRTVAPLGASVTVAYFGWVDTEMVREGLDRQQSGKRMQELLPKAFFKRIKPEQVALRIDPARPPQPGLRPADGARRKGPRRSSPSRGGQGDGSELGSAASRKNHQPAASSQPAGTSPG